MSYALDLDEFTDEQLHEELELRRRRRAKGRCDYCDRPYTQPACRFPKRHMPHPTPKKDVFDRLSDLNARCHTGEHPKGTCPGDHGK